MKEPRQTADVSHGLRDFFTNVDEPQQRFVHLATCRDLQTRVLFFWGVAGVGKSSLLTMLHSRARELAIPTALALAEDAYGEAPLLDSWVRELSSLHLKFPAFSRLKKRHRDLDN